MDDKDTLLTELAKAFHQWTGGAYPKLKDAIDKVDPPPPLPPPPPEDDHAA